jgi:copper transport protein
MDFGSTAAAALRHAVRWVAALLLAGSVMVIFAGPAAAHARLVSTAPEQGAVLAVAPTQVVLRFTETVRLGPDAVRVIGPGGRPVDLPTAPRSADGAVTVALPAGLANGAYDVSWRVLSDDAHPVAGALAFTVAQATGAAPAAPVGPAVDPASDERSDSPTVGVLYGLVRAAAYASFALLVGSVAVVLFMWPGGSTVGWVRRTWRSAGWALAGTTGAALLLQGAYGSGRGLGSALDLDGIATTLSLPLGIALLVRLALLVAVAGYLRVLLARPVTPALRWAGGGLAVGLALTWSATGHASTGPQPVLGIPLDAAHLVAMGIWLGGLVVVARLCRGDGRVPAAEVLAAVQRFSPIALGCVLVLVATGGYAALRQVGSLDALLGTPYGGLLLVKLAAVALTVAAAAWSRRWASRLRLPEAPATRPMPRGRAGTITAPSRRTERRAAVVLASGGRRLGLSVLVEIAAATLVLTVTAALVTTEPARSAVSAPEPTAAAAGPAPTGPYVTDEIAFGSGPAGVLRVGVEPARVGTNTVVVLVADPAGKARDVVGLQATLALPEAGIHGLAAPLQRIEIGHHHGDVGFPMAGRWQLSITVQIDAVSAATVTAPIVIGGAG